MDSQDLVKRATQGALTQEELAEIATILEQSAPEMDLYPLLLAIGRSNAVRYRKLVETFLHCESEPMLASLALQILCDFWGDTERYIENIKQYVRGVPWDEEQDVRQIAVSTAGEYLRQHDDRELLEQLLTVFENTEEEQLIRENAYCALARAAGKDWSELPSATRGFNLKKDIDPTVLTEIRRRLV